MQKLVRDYLNELNRKQKKKRRAGVAALLLVVLVVGAVIGTLTQYGVAMTGDPICGKEDHQHGETCYTNELTCGQEESTGHTHTEVCYAAEKQLTCALEESEEHVHDDNCYTETSVLMCGEEESEGHQHSELCYMETLSCGKEEHQHTDGCFAEEGPDTDADVEDVSAWDAQYQDIQWMGNWGEDLVTAARVQLAAAYKESTANYTEAEDGSRRGYTRYGQFTGDMYRDWNAAFVNFCMYYAGLTESGIFPNEMAGLPKPELYPEGLTDSAKWIEEFKKMNEQDEKYIACLTEAEGYEPAAGDLVFLQRDKDNGEKENRMGIVSSYNNETGEIQVIEGDSEDEVKENTYGAWDGRIVNYLKMTELENIYKAAPEEEAAPTDETDLAGTEAPTDETDSTGTEDPTEETADPAETTDSTETADPAGETDLTETADPAQEAGEDENLMTLEELGDLPEDEVGATVWQQKNRARMFRMAAGRGWSFNAYYMNEEDSYDVTKTDDFSLKYQMEFRSGTSSLPAGAVEIRVPAALYKLRDSKEDVIPTDIAVPQINAEDKDNEEKWIKSKTSPFNCYIEENSEKEKELVFFNYKAIDAGTNAAWQVLYKKQKIMEIQDESSWKLTPAITVKVPNTETNKEGETIEGEPIEEKGETDPLTGRIDSKVDISQVTKDAYHMSGKKYTPGLYTKAQVERFIGGEEKIDGKYLKEDGTLNTDDYRYAVWSVQVKGTASQPFNLTMDEIPELNRMKKGILGRGDRPEMVKGEVVGIRDNSNRSLGYGTSVKPEKTGSEDGAESYRIVENCTEKNWGCRFYVVTAYSIKDLRIEENESSDFLNNQIIVNMEGVDQDPDTGKPYETDKGSNFATWTYVDYKWNYSGELLEITKKNAPNETREESKKHKEYTGWLKAYQTASEKGEDYGNLPYHTVGNFYGYPLTHYQSSQGTEDKDAAIGTYKKGTYYELTTVDDFMYAYSSAAGNGPTADDMLDWNDYYYSGITVTQTDKGYDIWEDRETKPEYEGEEDIDRDVKIYVMEKGETKWKRVEIVKWDKNKDTQVYTFSEEYLKENQPWRVKVVHAATDYRTTCKIDVNVNLRYDSAKLKALTAGKEDTSDSVKLEDISGIYGKFYRNDVPIEAYPSNGQDADNYGEPGLAEETKKLYEDEFKDIEGKTDGLLQRDNAFKDLTGVKEKARSVKASSSINDAANSRSLVEYYLTAFDGYQISRTEDYEYLKNVINSPGRKCVAFYDLLPYGMHFDPSYTVTAGRIKSLETGRETPRYETSWREWDRSQVQVKTDIEENYRGTGRTMVTFHIEYTGADSSRYNENDAMWWQGWGMNFRAYYEWKNLDIIEEAANISAFMTDTADVNYGDPSYPLHGEEGEVFKDDGDLRDLGVYQEDYKYFYETKTGEAGGIDKDARNDSFPSVLFARNKADTDVAVSAQANIQKRVRADDDMFNDYATNAVVEPGKGYTYEITMGMSDDMEEVVVYDILEDKRNLSAVDEPIYGDDNKISWQGTFQSIVTSGLEEMGITPEIYYRTSLESLCELDKIKDLNGPEDQDKLRQTLGSVETLMDGVKKGEWIKYDDSFKPDPDQPVKAIAVVVRKTDDVTNSPASGASGSGFKYVSFQIKMNAPDGKGFDPEKDSVYAYNNPLCYTRTSAAENKVETTLPGNAVKVRLKAYETLEVEKEYEGNVPSEIKKKNPSFEFRLSTQDQYLTNRQYELQVKEGNEWVVQPGIHATDGNGYLELHADEKAVFMVADASEVKVEETKNLFWEQTQVSGDITEGDTDTRIGKWIKVKNRYRPVLYVQKSLENVPEDKIDKVKDEEFTFQIWEDGKDPGDAGYEGVYEYYLVDSVRTDGGIPVIKEGPLETDKKGKFQIKQGEIAALFPGPEGTAYHLKEVIPPEDVLGTWDWICDTKEIVDRIPINGDSKTIKNNYRWKDLYLTKDLTHQNPEECTQEFTFKITKIVTNPLTGEKSEEPVNGNRWVLMERNKDGDLTEAKDGDGKIIEGIVGNIVGDLLEDAGTLTCACAGKVIKIEGLEAGETYAVTETGSGENYTPVNPSEEIKMPIYSSNADVKITNDYQMRSLSVSKEVIKGGAQEDGERPEESFIMEVKVDGKLLAEKTYILKKKDGTIITSEEGKELKTDKYGRFNIKDGETATFENVGKKGTDFEVSEITNEDQVYPANKKPHTGTLSDEDLTGNVKTDGSGSSSRYGSGVTFRNGSDDILIISKEYRCADEDKAWLAEMLEKEKDRASEIGSDPYSQFAVTVTLTATKDGKEFDWAGAIENAEIKLLDDEGKESTIPYTGSFKLEPWQKIVIPVNESLKGAQFTLKETESPEGILEVENESGESVLCQVSKEEPEKTGTFGVDLSAMVYNRIERIEFQGQPVEKRLEGVIRGEELPDGNLVWRLQKYEGGRWVPVEGARYMIYDTLERERDTDVNTDPPMLLMQMRNRSSRALDKKAEREPRSKEILTTDEGGRIILTRREPSYEEGTRYWPTVYFLDEELKEVKLNLQEGKEGDYRLIEDMEESDDAWGMFAGAVDGNLKNEKIFYNTILKEQLEIGKVMADGSRQNETFTMILKQVAKYEKEEDRYEWLPGGIGIPIEGDVTEITESYPVKGIPYILCTEDPETGEITETGKETGANGEITLKAGQYVKIELPMGTKWTVEEEMTNPSFELAALTPEEQYKGETIRLTKWDAEKSGTNDLMLIELMVQKAGSLLG